MSHVPVHASMVLPLKRAYYLTLAVFGPDDTPWEGGIFSLRITFTDNYPEKPPRVRFTSDMFHPNVYRCEATSSFPSALV